MAEQAVYRKLRKHLHSLPVGFPSTMSGVELRLLRFIFPEADVSLALALDQRFRTAGEILERLKGNSPHRRGWRESSAVLKYPTAEDLGWQLDGMASRGAVLRRETEDQPHYALIPFIIGMYELQLRRLTPEFMADSARYAVEGYAAEFLANPVRQSRIIPVEESVKLKPRIATYDELEHLIRRAGERIAVVPCICRTGRDMKGESCAYTDRRELCMVFRDYADTVLREGWGRKLSPDEALAIARMSQEEGLVLQPSNEQEPQFMCACCGDCCGLLAFIKFLPSPADFVQSSYHVELNSDACAGCGVCVRRCHMNALWMPACRGTVELETARCIGCGACVASCPKEALQLVTKHTAPPPENTEVLMENLSAGRLRGLRKAMFIGGILGQIAGARIAAFIFRRTAGKPAAGNAETRRVRQSRGRCGRKGGKPGSAR